MMTASDVCVLAGFPAEYAYILLDSGRDEGPAVLASIMIKEDGAAMISPSFIKAPHFTSTVFSLDGQEPATVFNGMLAEDVDLSMTDLTLLEGVHFAVYRFDP